MAVKGKPQLNIININIIHDEIMQCVLNQLSIMGYNNNGVDYSNEKKPHYISHNEINYILRQVYNNLFKPDKPLFNNQKSLVDYDNVELLQVLADTFLDICFMYNKALSLQSFSYMTGINYWTLLEWRDQEELNPIRSQIVKSIIQGYSIANSGQLSDTPIGQAMLANNDPEMGKMYARNQAQQITNNTVYYLPSERSDKLKLDKLEN